MLLVSLGVRTEFSAICAYVGEQRHYGTVPEWEPLRDRFLPDNRLQPGYENDVALREKLDRAIERAR